MKKILFSPEENITLSRKDLAIIADMIPQESAILDLGCGSGRLLGILKQLKHARVMGVEMEQEKIQQCVERGVPVIQADLDRGLSIFADRSYDFVILSETLQAVKRPDLLLEEMLRIGKTGIVNFINFAYVPDRLQLLFRGRMPETKALPHKWYNTPNIHLGTIRDFRKLCKEKSIRIRRELPLAQDGSLLAPLAGLRSNLFASSCIFIIGK